MMHEEYYGQRLADLERAERGLLDIIAEYPTYSYPNGMEPILYCRSRIKQPESMMRKLESRGLPTDVGTALATMHDAVGVRIVCSFLDDVQRVADWLSARPELEVVEIKDYIAHPKPNGYRSLHLILRLGAARHASGECGPGECGTSPLDPGALDRDGRGPLSREPGLSGGVIVEVQLRTIALDFWAALEHQLKYKRPVRHGDTIRDELKRCSDEIASVDVSMQTLRDLILEDRWE